MPVNARQDKTLNLLSAFLPLFSRWWSTYGCRVMLPKTSQAPFTIPPGCKENLAGWQVGVNSGGANWAAARRTSKCRAASPGGNRGGRGCSWPVRQGAGLGNIDTGRRHHMAAMALQCYPTTCHIRGCRLPHTPAFKERAQVPTAPPPVALQS